MAQNKFSGPSEDCPMGRPETLSDIEVVFNPFFCTITTREGLVKIVEKPLLLPCQIFYDKNVRTIGNHAHSSSSDIKQKRDVRCYVLIDYDLLSEENQEIGKQLGTVNVNAWSGKGQILGLEKHFRYKTLALEVQNYFTNLAQQFKQQDLNWGTYSIDEVLRIICIDSQSCENPFERAKEIGADLGMAWDETNEVFYMSRELYNKAHRS